MAKAITIQKVSKSFGGKPALDNVSFSVDEGKIFGFLGPNGAGKTTTIRCIMDLVRPDTGTITVSGYDSQKDAVAVKRLIGYLPADAPLYPNWTGQDHINFVAGLRGADPDPAIAKSLDFDPGTKARQLSTGNKQKLSIILAMIGRPKLLVLDEPTRGLDPLMQNQLYDILRDFRDGGGTVFMSSHNLPEVEKICDSLSVIRAGHIAVEETLDSLKSKSIYNVTASFSAPVEARQFRVAGYTVLHHSSSSVTLRVKGDINPLLHILAHHPVKNLEISHASLEEIFLELYQ